MSGDTIRTLTPGNAAAPAANLPQAHGAEVARVGGDHGRALGAAVAFDRSHTEFFLNGRSQRLWQFLRAGHHNSQTPEIPRLATAQVDLQEARRGHEVGDAVAPDQFADRLGVERIWMISHAHAQQCRGNQRGGKPERMEEWQDAKKPILRVQVEHLPQLLGVGGDVVMREHYALRLAGAAARKDHGGQVIERTGLLAANGLFQSAHRGEPGERKGAEFFAQPGPGDDFFQQERAAGHLHLHAVEKGLRGQNGLQLALARAGGQHLLGKGVVEVDRHFAQQQRGEVDQRARHRWRQENADHVLPGPGRPQSAGEEDDLHQCTAETQPRHAGIGPRQPQRTATGALNKGPVQQLHGLASVRPGVGVQLLDGGLHFERRGGRWQWPAKADRDRVGQASRHFPKEPARLIAEDAAPDAVQADRND
ncbi:MAG: hypothetical protein RMK20_07665, partial [Verrucomicrobiales bacterium]|nr:hypothetical protein [Verrucomicrobiales bacterium]